MLEGSNSPSAVSLIKAIRKSPAVKEALVIVVSFILTNFWTAPKPVTAISSITTGFKLLVSSAVGVTFAIANVTILEPLEFNHPVILYTLEFESTTRFDALVIRFAGCITMLVTAVWPVSTLYWKGDWPSVMCAYLNQYY